MMSSEENKRTITEDHDGGACENELKEVVIHIAQAEHISGVAEETKHVKPWRKPNLSLEIPSRSLETSQQEFVQIQMPATPTATPRRVNFQLTPNPSDSGVVDSPGPSSSRGRSSIKNFFPKLSFKCHGSNFNVDKDANLDSASSNHVSQENSSLTSPWSLTRIFNPRMKRTSSLPVTALTNSNLEPVPSGSDNSSQTSDMKEEQRRISRSLSVPAFSKDVTMRKVDSFIRVIPATPRMKDVDSKSCDFTPEANSENKEVDGEDILEEEAVCRICMVELCEGGETLKMECSCKGELALAHKECAVKWFGIKGNKTCDVCKQDVQNLPVTLLRVQSSQFQNTRPSRVLPTDTSGFRVWQEVPILVIISMLAYFCFLEQLLIGKLGTGAIAITLPFSCVLGLLASITSSTMVKSRYVWIYASIQFALVVLFAHIFYSLIHVQAILSILLATFAGFGVAMTGSSVVVEILRWRSQLSAPMAQRPSSQVPQRRSPPVLTLSSVWPQMT